MPPTLPLGVDSGFESIISVTGRDDALFILGVNSFVRDNDLAIAGFSRGPVPDASEAKLAAFSISEEVRDLKLSFGKRAFIDLALEEEGPGDPLVLATVLSGVKRKFTFLGVGLGVVGGILIPTKSGEDASDGLEGISRKRFCRFQG